MLLLALFLLAMASLYLAAHRYRLFSYDLANKANRRKHKRRNKHQH
ncbi:MAG: hypothetical protein RLZZ367_1399 [Bacteroidota bacterium]|jgi:hypothetical protein